MDDIREKFRQNNPNFEIEQKFSEKFNVGFPESINENHRMIIVASELDNSTDGTNKYPTRTWLVDHNIVEQRAKKTKTREPWN